MMLVSPMLTDAPNRDSTPAARIHCGEILRQVGDGARMTAAGLQRICGILLHGIPIGASTGLLWMLLHVPAPQSSPGCTPLWIADQRGGLICVEAGPTPYASAVMSGAPATSPAMTHSPTGASQTFLLVKVRASLHQLYEGAIPRDDAGEEVRSRVVIPVIGLLVMPRPVFPLPHLRVIVLSRGYDVLHTSVLRARKRHKSRRARSTSTPHLFLPR
jgi:hypothetical protein